MESAVINFMALKDHTDSSLLVSVPVDSSSLASNLQLDDRQNLVSFKNASPRVLPHPRFLTETSHSGTGRVYADYYAIVEWMVCAHEHCFSLGRDLRFLLFLCRHMTCV